jgi:hypothetical protein
MKYTIVYGDPQTPFIQQRYETIEEAQARLKALQAKFGEKYALAIVSVDDQGAFHALADA